MDLGSIFVSHWKLRNPSQVPGMVEAILAGELLPPIVLFECEDGVVQILDGHHRAAAYWISGRGALFYGEYVLLLQPDLWRPRRGPIAGLVAREFPQS